MILNCLSGLIIYFESFLSYTNLDIINDLKLANLN